VLPVIAGRPGWVRVRLPSRPNGSTAWVKTDDVTLGTTPYRIVIDRGAIRLRLYDAGRLAFSAPAGVGAAGDPTPAGNFFVAFDEDPPRSDAGYGPFIMVTSAHSTSIKDWKGSGDAIVGIHGPLGEAREIGVTGALVSHGCVRLRTTALRRLRQVPPGTPVDIAGLPSRPRWLRWRWLRW
jgi:lipoprotein-anchoring transpeptidase ErfK/SrfK